MSAELDPGGDIDGKVNHKVSRVVVDLFGCSPTVALNSLYSHMKKPTLPVMGNILSIYTLRHMRDLMHMLISIHTFLLLHLIALNFRFI